MSAWTRKKAQKYNTPIKMIDFSLLDNTSRRHVLSIAQFPILFPISLCCCIVYPEVSQHQHSTSTRKNVLHNNAFCIVTVADKSCQRQRQKRCSGSGQLLKWAADVDKHRPHSPHSFIHSQFPFSMPNFVWAMSTLRAFAARCLKMAYFINKRRRRRQQTKS